MSKRGYYRDPRLGGGAWREMLERRAADQREILERRQQEADQRLLDAQALDEIG